MSTYTVAQARDNLSKLIAAAERGEDVRIARNGQPAVRLISDAPKGVVIDVAELKRRRVMPKAGPTDILEILDEMRRDRPW
ncbi:type II toxin-antitoxin system prevent-host-death family antitoxin [Brevundimonas sp.]|jgi:prevent-host-death family protein|uniref:type II toxin-antitoxin system Phd/YefM family antitoxin n=1 Tax=Brevundimonas sp. TaxID=1871086 RepID=UPI002488FD8A|nr:type II toxin-antitoxin system prevent-host-death family antitoxin [Brevundimonas sp.]MDI1281065.1 type II toxin-antitoxin system prevent-host-death family antitoxin [Brevundimonas sp.]